MIGSKYMISVVFAINYSGPVKRFFVYPLIVGYVLHYLISAMVEMTPDNIDFPVVTYYADFFAFLNLSSSLITIISFYFLGYGFGLISTFLSVRRLRTGYLFSLIITIAKVSFLIVNCIILPFVFVIDLSILAIRILIHQKKKNRVFKKDDRHERGGLSDY